MNGNRAINWIKNNEMVETPKKFNLSLGKS